MHVLIALGTEQTSKTYTPPDSPVHGEQEILCFVFAQCMVRELWVLIYDARQIALLPQLNECCTVLTLDFTYGTCQGSNIISSVLLFLYMILPGHRALIGVINGC